MGVDRKILSDFIKMTNDNTTELKPKIMHGTIIPKNGVDHVKIDGSDIATPFRSTIEVKRNDRVIVEIENHKVRVTGNLSDPSSSGDRVTELEKEVDGIDIHGVVRFHDLEQEGMTVINGANITTGTLSGDRIQGGLLDGVRIKVDGGGMMSKYNLAGIYMSCAGIHINSGSSEAIIDGGRLDVMKDQFTNSGIAGKASGLAVSGSGSASVAKDMYANNFLSRYSLNSINTRNILNSETPSIDDLNVVMVDNSYKIKIDNLYGRSTLGDNTNPYIVHNEDFGIGLNLESVVASLIISIKELKEENRILKEQMGV